MNLTPIQKRRWLLRWLRFLGILIVGLQALVAFGRKAAEKLSLLRYLNPALWLTGLESYVKGVWDELIVRRRDGQIHNPEALPPPRNLGAATAAAAQEAVEFSLSLHGELFSQLFSVAPAPEPKHYRPMDADVVKALNDLIADLEKEVAAAKRTPPPIPVEALEKPKKARKKKARK